jgi:hypothetical protein
MSARQPGSLAIFPAIRRASSRAFDYTYQINVKPLHRLVCNGPET